MTLYVVDTNVLFDWALSYTGYRGRNEWRLRQSRRFCEDHRNQIHLPGLVLLELHGVFLHKGIDLERYDLWFRKRKAALQPLQRLFYGADSHFELGEDEFDGNVAASLCTWPANQKLRNSLAELQAHRMKSSIYPPDRPPQVKLLDGVDAGIVATAYDLAKREAPRPVKVVSWDRTLVFAVNGLRGEKVYSYRFPENLTAGRPPKVRR